MGAYCVVRFCFPVHTAYWAGLGWAGLGRRRMTYQPRMKTVHDSANRTTDKTTQ